MVVKFTLIWLIQYAIIDGISGYFPFVVCFTSLYQTNYYHKLNAILILLVAVFYQIVLIKYHLIYFSHNCSKSGVFGIIIFKQISWNKIPSNSNKGEIQARKTRSWYFYLVIHLFRFFYDLVTNVNNQWSLLYNLERGFMGIWFLVSLCETLQVQLCTVTCLFLIRILRNRKTELHLDSKVKSHSDQSKIWTKS